MSDLVSYIRNNKKIARELGTKIKDLGQGFRVQGHSVRNRNNKGSYKLGTKNERTRNQEK